MEMRALVGYVLICLLLFMEGCAFVSIEKNPETKQLAHHPVVSEHLDEYNETSREYRFSSPDIIFQEKRGLFWIGNMDGIHTYDERSDQLKVFGTSQDRTALRWVRAISQDGKGKIWIFSSLNKELRYFDGELLHRASEMVSPDSTGVIHHVFPGSGDKLWFVADRGLVSYDGTQLTPPKRPSERNEQTYSRIQRRGNNEAASGSGQVHQTTHSSIIPDVLIGLEDEEGYVWLGTDRALFRISPGVNEWEIYPLPDRLEEVYRIYEDRQHKIWVADDRGHVSVRKSSNTWLSFDLAEHLSDRENESAADSLVINSLYQDREGLMMFGTDLGLITFIDSKNEWNVYNANNSSLPGARVTAISEDRSGRIWIGTNRGIVILKQ